MEPARSSEEPPQYVAQRIREALADDPRVGELDIHVRISGERVFLTGHVGTEERYRAVTEIVQGFLPDHKVVNEIAVPHRQTEGADLERLE